MFKYENDGAINMRGDKFYLYPSDRSCYYSVLYKEGNEQ